MMIIKIKKIKKIIKITLPRTNYAEGVLSDSMSLNNVA